MKVIAIHGVTKCFKSVVAVKNLSLEVQQGEIYGFVGLNGAGKTTTIRLLLGMLTPTNGTLFLFGKKIQRHFPHWNEVGFIVETVHAYPTLTVRENLELFCTLRKLPIKTTIDTILDRLHLTEYQQVLAKHLSLGNLQRLGLAKALLHRPSLLIVDEPLNGLDPAGIIEIREYFKELANNGTTIFISSHILEELAKVATKIGILHRGQFLKERSTEQLMAELEKKLIVSTNNNYEALILLQQHGYNAILNKNNVIELNGSSALEGARDICVLLTNHGLPPHLLSPQEERLESYFMRTISGCTSI